MPESKATKKDHHAKSKECQCEHCACWPKSVFPICLLSSIMTGLLVALCFTAAIVATINYERQNDYFRHVSGSFVRETDGKSKSFISLSASALIDFFGSGETGFIYASTGDCTTCQSFKDRLEVAANETGVSDKVFIYHYPNNPSETDKKAHSITIADEEGPVLLYVREGHIYDRLDETNGDLAIKTFLAKYK